MPGGPPTQPTAAAAAAAKEVKSEQPVHYATLGELHTHGLAALARRNPKLLGKITDYGADATIKPGISGKLPSQLALS